MMCWVVGMAEEREFYSSQLSLGVCGVEEVRKKLQWWVEVREMISQVKMMTLWW